MPPGAQLGDLRDAYVWLKRVSEDDVDDLVWSLWQGAVIVGEGEFDIICTTGDDKYTLVYPEVYSDFEQTDTFTVKVDWFFVGSTDYGVRRLHGGLLGHPRRGRVRRLRQRRARPDTVPWPDLWLGDPPSLR